MNESMNIDEDRLIQNKLSFKIEGNAYVIKIPNYMAVTKRQKPNVINLRGTYFDL